jgi:hypothetical protein
VTRWQVTWDPLAEDELGRIWLRRTDRAAVSAASARADRLLEQDPVAHGRHLSEGLYSLYAPPLIVTFTVDVATHTVEVTWVRET